MNVQILEKNGQPEWAVIPFAAYQEMLAKLEMVEDIRDYDAAMQRIITGEEVVPASTVDALLDGQNPIRVWRDHRGWTQQQVADKAGISKPYLSQLESGKRTGTTDVMARLAAALDLDLDDLAG